MAFSIIIASLLWCAINFAWPFRESGYKGSSLPQRAYISKLKTGKGGERE